MRRDEQARRTAAGHGRRVAAFAPLMRRDEQARRTAAGHEHRELQHAP
jgi:hypothetical protein